MSKLQGLFAQKTAQHQASPPPPTPPIVQAIAAAPALPTAKEAKPKRGKTVAPPPLPEKASEKVGKHRNSNFFKATLYLNLRTFQKFKGYCASNGLEMSDVVDRLLASYLQTKGVDTE